MEDPARMPETPGAAVRMCSRFAGCRKNRRRRPQLTWSLPPHSPAGALAGPSLHGPTPALSVQRGTGETHTAKALRALYVRTAAWPHGPRITRWTGRTYT